MIIHTRKNKCSTIHNTQENIEILCGRINVSRDGLICIASQPEMDKTALALYMALDYEKKSSKAVYIFTLEMTAEQLYDRLLFILSEVEAKTFHKKSLKLKEKYINNSFEISGFQKE